MKITNLNKTGMPLVLIPIGLALLLGTTQGYADVVFDHSALVPSAVQGRQLSGAMSIRADYGKQVGANLFHSFEHFTINQGETATFTNEGATAAIHHVIGRVTGGAVSTINGLLRSTISNADVYLLNPNGIVFAPEAQLDVQGAFHASTAASLDFKGGGRFNALTLDNDVLTAAPVQAFGFLEQSAQNNGAITLNGTQLNQTANAVTTIDLVAGSIDIKNNAVVIVPAGEIRLAAMQGAGDVSLVKDANNSLPLPTITPSAHNAGAITIVSGANNPNTAIIERSKLITSGNGSGRMALWGGDIVFQNARAFNDNETDSNYPEAQPMNATAEKGIAIQAQNLLVDNSFISTDANQANGSNINVETTNTMLIHHGGGIKSDVVSQGNAGNIIISAGDLTIDGVRDPSKMTGIYSNTSNISIGDAATIQVNANTLNIINGGHISSITQSSGQAGSIIMQAGTLNIADSGVVYSNSYAEGYAKNVAVQAKIVNITNGGRIYSSSFGKGSAGDVIVVVKDNLYIDGTDKSNNLLRGTGIFSEARKSGIGGSVLVKALDNTNTPDITISNGGFISSTTYSNNHNTGDVSITADTLTISKQQGTLQTGIFSNANQLKGNAGNIKIDVKTLTMNNGDILANTFAQGKAGTMVINVKERAFLNHYSQINSSASSGLGSTSESGGTGGSVILNAPLIVLDGASSISASSNTENKSGDIIINASLLKVINNSFISAFNTGFGNAGTININANDAAIIERNSKITVASNQNDAGDIRINAVNKLYLLDSEITTSAASGKGDGGNISIGTVNNQSMNSAGFKPTFVVLNGSSVVANALRGNGGKIDLLTRYFLQSTDSIVQASSQFGLQGTVSINSANANIAGSIAVLTGTFMDASKLIQEDCNKRYVQNSSFVVHSSNSVLPSPDNQWNYIPSAYNDCTASF